MTNPLPISSPKISRRGLGGPLQGRLPCRFLLLLLSLVLGSNAKGGEATAAATAAVAAAATAALMVPLQVDSKKVFGLARGGKFEAVGDFCFSIPEGTTGALVAETVRCPYTPYTPITFGKSFYTTLDVYPHLRYMHNYVNV